MDNFLMLKLRERLSKAYLDIAETLPEFQGGFIHHLQRIRKHQRKLAKADFEKRKKPDDAKIALASITFSMVFQLEDYSLMRKFLSGLFPRNKKVGTILQKMARDESSISGAGFGTIGEIVSRSGFSIGDSRIVKELPEEISSIEISYNKIIPSVCGIVISFRLKEGFAECLEAKQNVEYIPTLSFSRILYGLGSRPGYQMSGLNCGAKNAIEDELNQLEKKLTKWIKRLAKMNGFTSHPFGAVRLFKLSGGPNGMNERLPWIYKCSGWVGDYGIDPTGYETFSKNDLFYSPRSELYETKRVHVILGADGGDSDEDAIEAARESVAALSILDSLVFSLQRTLERNRIYNYRSVFSARRGLIRKAKEVAELKRLIVNLQRIGHECKESNGWLSMVLEGIGGLTTDWMGQSINLRDNYSRQLSGRIEELLKSANLLDAGVTGYLSVENIYASYRLQRRILILTIIAAVATMVGVISSWENIWKLYSQLRGEWGP